MIRFVVHTLTKKPEPKECRPNGTPGWYVLDRASSIFAYTDTEEEADRVIAAFGEMLLSLMTLKTFKADPRCLPSLAGGLNPLGTTDNGHLPGCNCEVPK